MWEGIWERLPVPPQMRKAMAAKVLLLLLLLLLLFLLHPGGRQPPRCPALQTKRRCRGAVGRFTFNQTLALLKSLFVRSLSEKA